MAPRNLWLVGMMASGKSSVGRRVAEAVGAEYADTDQAIVAGTGRTVSDLWGDGGEEVFREMEAATVASLAAGTGRIVATGGGVVIRDDNVAAMRSSGIVVWLEASPATLAWRIGDGAGRPLIAGLAARDRLDAILDERRDAYRAAAHHRVDTDAKTAEQVAEEVIRIWYAS